MKNRNKNLDAELGKGHSELTADPLTTSFQGPDFTSTIDLEEHLCGTGAGPSSEPTSSLPSAFQTVSKKIVGLHAEEVNNEHFDKLKSSLEGSTRPVNDVVLNSHDLNSSATCTPIEHSDKREIH